eukprot:symbB.v1.2.036507.t1/scaffold5173.1/size30160/2
MFSPAGYRCTTSPTKSLSKVSVRIPLQDFGSGSSLGHLGHVALVVPFLAAARERYTQRQPFCSCNLTLHECSSRSETTFAIGIEPKADSVSLIELGA